MPKTEEFHRLLFCTGDFVQPSDATLALLKEDRFHVNSSSCPEGSIEGPLINDIQFVGDIKSLRAKENISQRTWWF